MNKKIIATLVTLGIVVAVWYIAVPRSDGPVFSPTPVPTLAATPLADNLVILDEPLPESFVSSPLTVRGKARGTWFFEASFPVILTDWDGRIIAETYAQAQSDWMTTEFVPFEATVTFDTPAGPGINQPNRGFLILKKDNPSDLPEFDDAREIMVFFK